MKGKSAEASVGKDGLSGVSVAQWMRTCFRETGQGMNPVSTTYSL